MKQKRTTTLVGAVVLAVTLVNMVAATVPVPIRPVPADDFRPITVAASAAPGPSAPHETAAPSVTRVPVRVTPPPRRQWPALPKVERPATTSLPLPVATSHSVAGMASYYCSPAKPICFHGYPPGSMVAAACGKLRVAMGSHWRGSRVTVTHGSAHVVVALLDWCGSTDKLIDLYQWPMHLLGGTGVLPVTVRW